LVSKRHTAQQVSKVSDSTAGCDDTKRGWNSVEGKEIIANADYLRQVMVRFLSQQTDEDREMGKTFSKALGGDFQNCNPVAAANYLEALRLILGPPTLTVTVHDSQVR
jgi:hypothetical protein